MKFEEYKYERPDLNEVQKQYEIYNEQLKACTNVDDFMKLFKEINVFRGHISSMMTLASLRYTINTADEFYEKENDYWDEKGPFFQQCNTQFYQAILESPLRKQLEEKIPKTFFSLIENELKCFDEKILEDLQTENKLSSEYQKLLASAKIELEGKTYNLSGLSALTESKDRSLRQKAAFAYVHFFEEHEEELDRIFDDLVHVRHQMAQKLGYKNFTEMGYVRMNRLDYNEAMVDKYRQQVLKDVVPLANELSEKQRKRLHLDQLHFYDLNLEFESGNPTPKGTSEELVSLAKQMYHELSQETGEFFDFMVENHLLDLVSKPNKASGGYCTYIEDYEAPFIFSNFNGTSGDVDVLTHEAGHAFQVYQSREVGIPEIEFPTYESCEIHSMSMEFITWPWSKNFFKEDTEKYHYLHLGSAVKFIPYGILVDHFQHVVYNQPDLTPSQRKQAWRDLEKMYLPYKNYEDCDFLERGGYWYRQRHIYESPFYYIDYTLAQVCALQFWNRFQKKDETAWQDYLTLCQLGGTRSFLQLLEAAHLNSPFMEGGLHDCMSSAKAYLESVDDTSL